MTQSPTTSPSPRTRRLHALSLVVAVGLLGYVLWSNRHLVHQVLDRRPEPAPYLLAAALYLVALFASFSRWFFLVRMLGLKLPFADALRLGCIGNVFNLVIPGGVGGDVVKAGYLLREQSNGTAAVASVVLDRAIGMLALFLLAAGMGSLAWSDAPPVVRRLILVVAALALLLLVAGCAMFIPGSDRLLRRLLPRGERFRNLAEELRVTAETYRSRPLGVLLVLVFSLAVHGLLVLAFHNVSKALFPADPPSLLAHFLIVPLVIGSTAVPLPLGALGLSEQVSAELFQLVGHPGGAVVMLGYRLLLYLGALVSLAVYARNPGQARRLARRGEDALHPAAGPPGHGLSGDERA